MTPTTKLLVKIYSLYILFIILAFSVAIIITKYLT